MVKAVEQSTFQKMLELSTTPAALQDTESYLSEHLRKIIRKGESVLVCFPRGDEKSLGSILEHSVLAADGVPVFWEGDFRWSELLRLAFFSRASTIIGTPLTVLGLSKLAAYRHVPLFIFNAITTGYACLEWMNDGITSGLDCQTWGILAAKLSSIVVGFSCDRGRGIHLRQDMYDFRIMNEQDEEVPDGTWGRVHLTMKEDPSVCMKINTSAMLMDEPCSCGDPAPKLVGMDYGSEEDAVKYRILEELLYWNSILDCWVEITEHGMELEVLHFPGLKLPKFPSCAKLVLRPWNPDEDIPYEIRHYLKKQRKLLQS